MLAQPQCRHERPEDAEGQVDQEYPRPTRVLNEIPAHDRSEGRRKNGRDDDDAELPMVGSATLTIVASMYCMNELNTTTVATIHLYSILRLILEDAVAHCR